MSGLWFETALLPEGWAERVRVEYAAGRIVRLETGRDPEPDDERHVVAIPGLCNVHSHAFQRGLAGLTESRGSGPDSFWSWRELMYRFLERMGPEELEAVTALAFSEMLEAGFTRVGEFHYIHHDHDAKPFVDPGELAVRVLAAAAQTGVALTLLPVFYAHGGFGGADPAPRQRRFVTSLEQFVRVLESSRSAASRVTGSNVGIAPHSLRAVTPAELTSLVQLAADAPLHIHIAEQTKEVDDCLAWSGRRPIEWLMQAQQVDARWCLVHATHATESELGGIASSGAVVGLCPMTESSLGDGIFPAVTFLAHGGRYAIGSDSNILLDAAAELRTLEYSQRLAHRARNVLATGEGRSTGRSLFDAALAGGAQALRGGASAEPPGLAVGGPADLVSLAATHPALLARRGDALLDSWIFSAGREAVDCVWRGGVKMVANGRHRDRDRIVARYGLAMRCLLA